MQSRNEIFVGSFVQIFHCKFMKLLWVGWTLSLLVSDLDSIYSRFRVRWQELSRRIKKGSLKSLQSIPSIQTQASLFNQVRLAKKGRLISKRVGTKTSISKAQSNLLISTWKWESLYCTKESRMEKYFGHLTCRWQGRVKRHWVAINGRHVLRWAVFSSPWVERHLKVTWLLNDTWRVAYIMVPGENREIL